MSKIQVGILGATGAAGLEFVKALADHPVFEIAEFYASERSAGKTLEEACVLEEVKLLPERIRKKVVMNINKADTGLGLLCSALPSEVAKEVEGKCAQHTPVISTTSAYRYENDVPVIITEINADHYKLLEEQKYRGWKGWIAPGPNCTTVGLVMSLAPLYRAGEIERVIMSSYQSVSGGGAGLIEKWRTERKPGLPEPEHLNEPATNPSLALDGNVIGYIDKEEGKVRKETLKILGAYDRGIIPAGFLIDCTCVRVPTLRGHFETVFVELSGKVSPERVKEIYAEFNDKCAREYGDLYSSPKQTIVVLDRPPQPRFDSFIHGGMSAVIGRIEQTDVFGGLFNSGIKYEVLSNNTERGAAKGMVHVAEYLHKQGIL